MAKLPRVPVPLNRIEIQFEDQLQFLRRSCEEYDAGHTAEYRRLALSMRVLLYTKGQSQSLMKQLGLGDVLFASYIRPNPPGNLVAWLPMARMRLGFDEARFVPMLDQAPYPRRDLTFEDWWNEEAFSSPEGVTLARGDFVAIVANQDGGAHVDPELDERFHRLANENLAGWLTGPLDEGTALAHIERVHLRHIAFECLTSLEAAWQKRLGNRICQCGSERKHRYCCGKKSRTTA